ncbi:MAG: helix-turn-helix domain-containing protein [Streptosporangiales bacterium]|nr:helix-turn-helix domain-containing protein [Streptosporangiales bacterium]
MGTEAAARVADVLLLFTGGPASLGVSTISRELGLAKAVVHRILRSLASRELLVTDPGTRGYRLGPAAAALGARALRDSTLRSAAAPVLRRLRDETYETTTLSELVGDARVYLDQFESPQEIKMTVEVGRRFPLHTGASGKVILACFPEPRREAVLAGPLAVLTPQTVSDPARLRAELADIARRGAAVSHGERQVGAASVAAPVFGVDGEVAGAISVCGPVDRFGAETCARYVPAVRAAAEEISAALGWAAPTRG